MRNWTQVVFFFFKQKTAYEVRISDWSSDVCSSDLIFSLYFNCLTPDSKSPRHCGAALPGKSCRPRGKDFRLLQRWRAAVPYESTADESARGVSAAAMHRERRRLPGTPACEGGKSCPLPCRNFPASRDGKNGRASGRERGCQSAKSKGVAGTL